MRISSPLSDTRETSFTPNVTLVEHKPHREMARYLWMVSVTFGLLR